MLEIILSLEIVAAVTAFCFGYLKGLDERRLRDA